MKKGINYDTGFLPEPDRSRKAFDRDTVRRDLQVIARELSCRAVRVSEPRHGPAGFPPGQTEGNAMRLENGTWVLVVDGAEPDPGGAAGGLGGRRGLEGVARLRAGRRAGGEPAVLRGF